MSDRLNIFLKTIEEDLDIANEAIVPSEAGRNSPEAMRAKQRGKHMSKSYAKMEGEKKRKIIEAMRKEGKNTQQIANMLKQLHINSPVMGNAKKIIANAKGGELIEKYDGSDPRSMHPDHLYQLADPKNKQAPFIVINGKLYYISIKNKEDEYNKYDGVDASYTFTHSGIVYSMMADDVEDNTGMLDGIYFDTILDAINKPDDSGMILGRYLDGIVSYWNSKISNGKANKYASEIAKKVGGNVEKIYIPKSKVNRRELGIKMRDLLNAQLNTEKQETPESEANTQRYDDATPPLTFKMEDLDHLLNLYYLHHLFVSFELI